MASLVKGFIGGVAQGFFGSDYLRDYQHASKTFRAGNYNFAPRPKFLFHVYFNLNTAPGSGIEALNNIFKEAGKNQSDIGLLVKTVQLPSYDIDVEVMNQYNRKRLIQKRINYNPCQFTFHDDNSDLIRNLWYNYFSYYYKDPSQQYFTNVPPPPGQPAQGGGAAYNARDIYEPVRQVNDWGYIGENSLDGKVGPTGKAPFLRDITIYGLSNGPDSMATPGGTDPKGRPFAAGQQATGKNFCAYVLINPLITDWRHDTYDYSQGNQFMEHQMTVRYETVKYYAGKIDGARPSNFVKGFADPARYDITPSPLTRPGSRATILGPGGLVDAVGGIVTDLQEGSVQGVIRAVQKAGTAYKTFKGQDLKAIVKDEATAVLTDVARQELPKQTRTVIGKVDSFIFPKAPVATPPIVPASPAPIISIPRQPQTRTGP